jgi:hypothetical protein
LGHRDRHLPVSLACPHDACGGGVLERRPDRKNQAAEPAGFVAVIATARGYPKTQTRSRVEPSFAAAAFESFNFAIEAITTLSFFDS